MFSDFNMRVFFHSLKVPLIIVFLEFDNPNPGILAIAEASNASFVVPVPLISSIFLVITFAAASGNFNSFLKSSKVNSKILSRVSNSSSKNVFTCFSCLIGVRN